MAANTKKKKGDENQIRDAVNSPGAALAVKILTVLIIASVCVGSLVFGFASLRKVLFADNPKFELKDLKIATFGTVSPNTIKQVTGIHEGRNLFSFDISKIRRDFLRNVPNVRNIEIERILPDGMEIRVYEREAKACISRSSGYVADFDGYVFEMSTGLPVFDTLPQISGEELAGLVPGSKLGARARLALLVIDIADANRLSFKISAVDITDPNYMILHTSGRKIIRLMWEQLRDNDRKKITRMLTEGSQCLRSPRFAKLVRLDINDDSGRHYGSP